MTPGPSVRRPAMTSSEQLVSPGSAKFDCPPTSATNAGSSGTSSKSHSNRSQSFSKPHECYGCHKPIVDRYLLKALEKHWHESCLSCNVCGARLGEVGSTLFTKADLILCKRDYLR